MNDALPEVVSEQDWQKAFDAMLVKEKELTRARDEVAAARRRMPMVRVEKDYRFVGPDGEVGLLDLFAGRRQLVVYRFFFEPGVGDWPHSGCPGCSFFTDHVPDLAHVNARDTTFVLASPADQDKIAALKRADGLARAMVHDGRRRLRRGLRGVGVVRHQRVPPRRRRPRVPHLLRHRPRRRAVHADLGDPRRHPLRTAGGVGGRASPVVRRRRPTSGGACTTSTGAADAVSRRGPGAARR